MKIRRLEDWKIGRLNVVAITLLAIVILGQGGLFGDDWKAYRSDGISRDGGTDELLPPKSGTPLTLKWSVLIGGGSITSSPTVQGGRVFIGAENGGVYSYDATGATNNWSYFTEGYVRSTATYYKGRIYIGSRDGNLYCLNAGTGQLLWKRFHGGTQVSSPLAVNDRVFIGVGDPSTEVRAYDSLTGELLWNYPTGQTIYSSPAYYNGLVIVGNNAGRWVALSEAIGEKVWEYSTNYGVFLSTPSVSNGKVAIAPGEMDRAVYLLDAMTGVLVWKKTPTPSGSFKVGGTPGGDATVSSPESMVDKDTLQLLLNSPKQERDDYLTALAAANNIDYTPLRDWLDLQLGDAPGGGQGKPLGGGGGGDLYAVNLNKAVKTSSPTFVNGRIYITQRQMSGVGADEFISYCMDEATGNVLWSTTPVTFTILNPGYVPDVAVSGGTYAYIPIGNTIYVNDAISGVLYGSVNVGSQITGSPSLADGRLYVATESGYLLCYDTANRPPSMPTSFNPYNGISVLSNTPTISWSGASDPDGGALSYELVLGIGAENSDLEPLGEDPIVVGSGSTSYQIAPALPNSTHIYYKVRSKDSNGAYSPWSAVQDFWIARDIVPPEPPSNVVAIPQNMAAIIMWALSPSTDVKQYHIYYKKDSEPWASSQHDLAANIEFAHTVNGLENGQGYDFMVTAEDYGENESAGVIVSATPGPSVTINGGGVAFATIQDALTAASPGDTVTLGAGTFPIWTGLNIKAGVSIRGLSPRWTRLVASNAYVGINVIPPDTLPALPTVISNLSLTGSAVGIDANTEKVEIRNVLIYKLSWDGIAADAGGDITVVNVTIMDCLGNGIRSNASATVIKNSIIGNNSGYGIEATASAVISYNDVYGSGLGDYPSVFVDGGGNISTPAVFIETWTTEFFAPEFGTESAANYYRDQTSSPTVDAGDPADAFNNEPAPNGGRINMGAYGNTPDAATSPTKPTSPGGGGGGGGGGGCFIATAAGSDLGTLARLCNFRDKYLLSTPSGRAFVTIYNEYGPVAASYIRESNTAKSVAMAVVVKPLDVIASMGIFVKAFLMLMLASIAFIGVRRLR